MSLYCDTPLPVFAEDICANEEGRIIASVLLRSDHAITDPTSKAQWDAGLANGTVVIIKNVKGSKPKGSPVQVDGYGRQKTRTVGYGTLLLVGLHRICTPHTMRQQVFLNNS